MICSKCKLRALEIGGPVLKVEKSFQLANKNSFLRILPRWLLLNLFGSGISAKSDGMIFQVRKNFITIEKIQKDFLKSPIIFQ